MSELIGKVATILSATQLALNVGSAHGVSLGDAVVLHKTMEIRDPESREILGTVDIPKARLRVDLVQDKFCVATINERQGDQSRNLLHALNIAPLRQISETPVGTSSTDKVYVTVGERVVITTST
jgi:hypothetical protein